MKNDNKKWTGVQNCTEPLIKTKTLGVTDFKKIDDEKIVLQYAW